jgi:hypothetical protein
MSSMQLSRSETISQYSALSPATDNVCYKEGYAVDKMLEKAKPMLDYKSVNFLK